MLAVKDGIIGQMGLKAVLAWDNPKELLLLQNYYFLI